MSVSFEPVTRPDEIEDLATMAYEIWHEYWPAIIGEAQTNYMIENFQSLEAFVRDMSENAYEYWFLIDDAGNRVGYTGGHEEPETNRFFISKIYLRSDARGKGYARATVNFYNKLCHTRGLSAMYLTVNKHNELGVRAYKGTGFEVIDAVETDIGEGFIMDDYIMERPVN
ncbi:GNAT family N-acetyltransferase [Adlercreutzia agrestimuris]|uniref:GNAT family N-acetyltransferase n=1 Tax=Adlercreutzia agrestimuris TaxID=2941324 RepID=UPI00203BF5F8|nr:GNAT family N-acetyltransferase [Adlercreutzia agrestimuris]